MYSFFRKRLSENEARRYVNQMTSAIHYMHKQNIMHRDIKLENAVLQSGGRVFIVGTSCVSGAVTRILGIVHCPEYCDMMTNSFFLSSDFGLSVDVSNLENPKLCGSPTYMAPEILIKQNVTVAADIWSL